jgi:hypothetical protein
LPYVGGVGHCLSWIWPLVGAFTCVALVLVSLRAARGEGVPERLVAPAIDVAPRGTAPVVFSEGLQTRGGDRGGAYERAAPNSSPEQGRVGRYPLFLALLIGFGQAAAIVLGLWSGLIRILRMPSWCPKE